MSPAPQISNPLLSDELDALQKLADGETALLTLVNRACELLGASTPTNAVATALRRGLID
jgi:hypothetical protein